MAFGRNKDNKEKKRGIGLAAIGEMARDMQAATAAATAARTADGKPDVEAMGALMADALDRAVAKAAGSDPAEMPKLAMQERLHARTGAETPADAREGKDPSWDSKVSRSTVIRGQEGAREHRGLCYDPGDPQAFKSAEEIDAYMAAAHGL